MTLQEKFDYWKTYAERDLDAAEAMLTTQVWAFLFPQLHEMQQTREKWA